MQTVQPNPIARDDTFFGVCEALGEDFGFHANWLRAALALLLFWNPLAAVGGYVAAGAVVLLSRWLVPNPRVSAELDGEPAVEAAAEQMPLPLAA